MLPVWIRDGEAYIIVYDITNKQSFETLNKLLEKIFDAWEDQPTPPIVIAGNKCDLQSLRLIEKRDSYEFTHFQGKSYKIDVLETSAKDGTNCSECVMTVVNQLAERKAKNKSSGSSSS